MMMASAVPEVIVKESEDRSPQDLRSENDDERREEVHEETPTLNQSLDYPLSESGGEGSVTGPPGPQITVFSEGPIEDQNSVANGNGSLRSADQARTTDRNTETVKSPHHGNRATISPSRYVRNYKLVVCGAGGTGKTSLTIQVCIGQLLTSSPFVMIFQLIKLSSSSNLIS